MTTIDSPNKMPPPRPIIEKVMNEKNYKFHLDRTKKFLELVDIPNSIKNILYQEMVSSILPMFDSKLRVYKEIILPAIQDLAQEIIDELGVGQKEVHKELCTMIFLERFRRRIYPRRLPKNTLQALNDTATKFLESREDLKSILKEIEKKDFIIGGDFDKGFNNFDLNQWFKRSDEAEKLNYMFQNIKDLNEIVNKELISLEKGNHSDYFKQMPHTPDIRQANKYIGFRWVHLIENVWKVGDFSITKNINLCKQSQTLHKIFNLMYAGTPDKDLIIESTILGLVRTAKENKEKMEYHDFFELENDDFICEKIFFIMNKNAFPILR